MSGIADILQALADRIDDPWGPWDPVTVDQPNPTSTIGPVSYAESVPDPLGEQSIFSGRHGHRIWKKLKKYADLPDGPYEVLGKGTRGTAYAVSPLVVLKVTGDHTEAVGAALIRDTPDPLGNAQSILSVWELRRPGVQAWAIVQERLSPLEDDDPWIEIADLWPAWARANGYLPIWPENIQLFVDDVETSELVDTDDPEWIAFKSWFFGLGAYLESIELRYHDFWHRNLLRRGSQHVAIDFGYSLSDARPPPKIDVISKFTALAGRRSKPVSRNK
jgi:hypothetical protein